MKEEVGGDEGNPLEYALENIYHRMIVDDILTRAHPRELGRLLNLVETGELEPKHFIAYVSNDRSGELLPDHRGTGAGNGQLWKFVLEDVRRLIINKLGKDQGQAFYGKTFEWLFDMDEQIVVNGRLNIDVAKQYRSHLEDSFEAIELAVIFTGKSDNIRKYILSAKGKTQRMLAEVNENNVEFLPNGRRITPRWVAKQESKLVEYDNALLRLEKALSGKDMDSQE